MLDSQKIYSTFTLYLKTPVVFFLFLFIPSSHQISNRLGHCEAPANAARSVAMFLICASAMLAASQGGPLEKEGFLASFPLDSKSTDGLDFYGIATDEYLQGPRLSQWFSTEKQSPTRFHLVALRSSNTLIDL